MRKYKVYLSGPIENAQDNGVGWREELAPKLKDLGFDIFNPIDASDPILNRFMFKSVAEYNQAKSNENLYGLYIAATDAFIQLDMDEVRTSDILLVFLSKTFSAGTAGEVTLAKHLNIPVIGFLDTNTKVSDISGWTLGCIDEIYNTSFDAINSVLKHAAQLDVNRKLS